MTHVLTLQLPSDIYEPLVAAAKRNGETPEALAAELLATMTRDLVEDPLEKHIGAYKSATPDCELLGKFRTVELLTVLG